MGQAVAYDSENRLISVKGGAVEFKYNGDGQRIAKLAGGKTTYSLYDESGNLVEELDSQGKVLNTFAWGADGLSERYHPQDGEIYTIYLYDTNGNVLHRVRVDDPALATGSDGTSAGVFAHDTVIWDKYGKLHADIDAYTGGFIMPDMVGYGGQWGSYTDPETLDLDTGAYCQTAFRIGSSPLSVHR